MHNGGPAFPKIVTARSRWEDNREYDMEGRDGMSLRDYFAAAALTGILANQQQLQNMDAFNETPAARAYEIADDMLAAREANDEH
jgi:hypothetical protein